MPSTNERTSTGDDRKARAGRRSRHPRPKHETTPPPAVSKPNRGPPCVALFWLAAAVASTAAACALVSWKDRRRPLTVTALPETAARGAYGGTSSARDGSDLRLRRTNGHEAVVDVDGPARRRIFLSKMAEEEEEDGAAEPEPRIVTSPIVGDSYLKHSTELRAPKSVTVDFRDSPQGEKGGPGGPGGSGDGSGGAVGFPPLEESTLMFLHVFKCAGSTLRRMLVEWAAVTGKLGAVVRRCDRTQAGEICLRHYELIEPALQVQQISHLKVLAGHFLWGFQDHVRGPYLMVTALRNPLEVFVSGTQYLHKKKTKTLDKAHAFVAQSMYRTAVQHLEPRMRPSDGVGARDRPEYQIGGFIRRFVGADNDQLFGDGLVTAADEAKRNLETFWLVGIVEQYAGFEEALRRSLDPNDEHRELWQKYSSHHYNTSPVETRDVLRDIDPDLVRLFNRSLALQWEVYEEAVSFWDARCREVLPLKMHKELCTVPPAPATYQ